EIGAARADALVGEAARARVTLGVIFQDRLKPDVVHFKKLAAGGDLGKPILGTARVKWHRTDEYYRQSRWRGTKALDGGGALVNQANHTGDTPPLCLGPARRVVGAT